MKIRPFSDSEVEAVFDSYPPNLRAQLLKLRQLIFEAASETDGVGGLIETLKWRQPAYLTKNPRCGTTLVSAFREIYSERLVFHGNRAVLFALDGEIPEKAVKHCIALALTYHSRRMHR